MHVDLSKGQVLSRFFRYIEEKGVPYCVMGDSRHYPKNIESDVDIVVPEELVSFCPRLVQAFAKIESIYLVQNLRHAHNAWYLVLAWRVLNSKPTFLALDICGNYFHNGRRFLEAQKLLEHRERASAQRFEDRSFYIPLPETEFMYYLLKKIVKGNLTSQQLEHLRDQYSRAPDKACKALSKFFPKSEVELVLTLLSKGDKAAFHSALPTLRDSLFHRIPICKGLVTNEYWRKVRRVLHPTGLMVVFLGPDGCGKSTVMRIVEQQLSPVFRRIRKYHLQPRLCRKDRLPPAVVNPHSESAPGSLYSFLKLAYLSLDYCIGYFFKVFPQLVCSTLVLFDRYYQDVLVDPRRFRCRDVTWFARLLGRFVPKPDLCFLLDADPEILQARKREVSFQETRRQREGYFKLIRSIHNGYLLDASKPIEEVAAKASEVVLKHLALRNENRSASDSSHVKNFYFNLFI